MSEAAIRPSLRCKSWPARRLFAAAGLFAAAALGVLAAGPAQADRIKHPIAVFSGLDKITGRIITFEVATDETVQFGTLQITERACYTRPATEAPQTTTFVEVDEVDAKNEYKRIFSGWMFAASPGLHGIEHPIYDIWLTDCKGGKEVIASPEAVAEPSLPPPENASPAPKKATKPRRVQPQPPQPPVDNFGEPPPIQDQAPVEVAPPPGFRPPPTQPRARRQAPLDDFESPVPPGDIPDPRAR
ncbi:DUF2155 domain-containing protein [Methylocella silvestris]|uniref:DUF2155 domain-containing protein n=1 Tax=Methylocella silvestris TaxID=199596 RepID=A0A2J7TKE0_METSI|nr:DUF2155 domain-containing protein [Methylocella silvestris]PNG27239.1 hypothetical protein CR492_03930 [Methylocella silvestris]